MVIAVQNSEENEKKNGELNFGINYILQWTNAMLKILNVVINVSFFSLPLAKPFYKPTQNLK